MLTVLGERLYNEALQAVHHYESKQRVAMAPALSYSKAKRILWEAKALGIKSSN